MCIIARDILSLLCIEWGEKNRYGCCVYGCQQIHFSCFSINRSQNENKKKWTKKNEKKEEDEVEKIKIMNEWINEKKMITQPSKIKRWSSCMFLGLYAHLKNCTYMHILLYVQLPAVMEIKKKKKKHCWYYVYIGYLLLCYFLHHHSPMVILDSSIINVEREIHKNIVCVYRIRFNFESIDAIARLFQRVLHCVVEFRFFFCCAFHLYTESARLNDFFSTQHRVHTNHTEIYFMNEYAHIEKQYCARSQF